MVFCFFIVTMLIVGGVIIYLINHGVLVPIGDAPKSHHLILKMMIASVLLGSVLSIATSRFPLKRVNAIINAMNRLASVSLFP